MQRSNAIGGLEAQAPDEKDEKEPVKEQKAKPKIPSYKYHVYGAKNSIHPFVIHSEYNFEKKTFDKVYYLHLSAYDLANYREHKANSSEKGLMLFLKGLSPTQHRELFELKNDKVFGELFKKYEITISSVLLAAERAKLIYDAVMTEGRIDGYRPSPVAPAPVYSKAFIEKTMKANKSDLDKKRKKKKLSKTAMQSLQRENKEWEREQLDRATWTSEALAGAATTYYPDPVLRRHNSDLYDPLSQSQPADEKLERSATPELDTYDAPNSPAKRQKLDALAEPSASVGAGSGSSPGNTLNISKALLSSAQREEKRKDTLSRQSAAPLPQASSPAVAASPASLTVTAMSSFRPAPLLTSETDEEASAKMKAQGQKRKRA